jgi:hypothetical protein
MLLKYFRPLAAGGGFRTSPNAGRKYTDPLTTGFSDRLLSVCCLQKSFTFYRLKEQLS